MVAQRHPEQSGVRGTVSYRERQRYRLTIWLSGPKWQKEKAHESCPWSYVHRGECAHNTHTQIFFNLNV